MIDHRSVAVVGLDLSLTQTGVAWPAGVTSIHSKGSKGADLVARAHRLDGMRVRVCDQVLEVAAGRPILAMVEAPAFGKAMFTGGTDLTGFWWMVVLGLVKLGCNVVSVPPNTLKKYATGAGNTPKDQLALEVGRRFPDHPVTNNDEADALVLCAMGCDWLGDPLVKLPAAYRAALDKVQFPPKFEESRKSA